MYKTLKQLVIAVTVLVLTSCSNEEIRTRESTAPTSQNAMRAGEFEILTPIPNDIVTDYQLDTNYYAKAIMVWGMPVLGPADLADELLENAAEIVALQLSDQVLNPNLAEAIRDKLHQHYFSVVIFTKPEVGTGSKEVPKFGQFDNANGYSAVKELPTMIAVETSVDFTSASDKSYRFDPFLNIARGNTLIHEITHSIHLLALTDLLPDFDSTLTKTFKTMRQQRLWQGASIQYVDNDGMGYIAENEFEYLAVGSELWHNVNGSEAKLDRPEGISLHEHLKQVDPDLYGMLSRFYNPKITLNPLASMYSKNYTFTCPISLSDFDAHQFDQDSYFNTSQLSYQLFIDGEPFSISKVSQPDRQEEANQRFIGLGYYPDKSFAFHYPEVEIPHPAEASSNYTGEHYRVQFYYQNSFIVECEKTREDILAEYNSEQNQHQ